MKVSKLDFYYFDLCIFNIVNQLMIRELHLIQLYVTHFLRRGDTKGFERCFPAEDNDMSPDNPLSAISTTGKKWRKRAIIQKLPRCISIVGKIHLKR